MTAYIGTRAGARAGSGRGESDRQSPGVFVARADGLYTFFYPSPQPVTYRFGGVSVTDTASAGAVQVWGGAATDGIDLGERWVTFMLRGGGAVYAIPEADEASIFTSSDAVMLDYLTGGEGNRPWQNIVPTATVIVGTNPSTGPYYCLAGTSHSGDTATLGTYGQPLHPILPYPSSASLAVSDASAFAIGTFSGIGTLADTSRSSMRIAVGSGQAPVAVILNDGELWVLATPDEDQPAYYFSSFETPAEQAGWAFVETGSHVANVANFAPPGVTYGASSIYIAYSAFGTGCLVTCAKTFTPASAAQVNVSASINVPTTTGTVPAIGPCDLFQLISPTGAVLAALHVDLNAANIYTFHGDAGGGNSFSHAFPNVSILGEHPYEIGVAVSGGTLTATISFPGGSTTQTCGSNGQSVPNQVAFAAASQNTFPAGTLPSVTVDLVQIASSTIGGTRPPLRVLPDPVLFAGQTNFRWLSICSSPVWSDNTFGFYAGVQYYAVVEGWKVAAGAVTQYESHLLALNADPTLAHTWGADGNVTISTTSAQGIGVAGDGGWVSASALAGSGPGRDGAFRSAVGSSDPIACLTYNGVIHFGTFAGGTLRPLRCGTYLFTDTTRAWLAATHDWSTRREKGSVLDLNQASLWAIDANGDLYAREVLGSGWNLAVSGAIPAGDSVYWLAKNFQTQARSNANQGCGCGAKPALPRLFVVHGSGNLVQFTTIDTANLVVVSRTNSFTFPSAPTANAQDSFTSASHIEPTTAS